jgi:hypothetical protein
MLPWLKPKKRVSLMVLALLSISLLFSLTCFLFSSCVAEVEALNNERKELSAADFLNTKHPWWNRLEALMAKYSEEKKQANAILNMFGNIMLALLTSISLFIDG